MGATPTLEDRVTKLERYVTDHKEDHRRLGDKVDTLVLDMATVKSDVNVLKEDVHTLKGDVSVLKEDVSTLKDNVQVLQTDVSALQTDVHQISFNMAGLTLRMTTIETQTKDLGKIRASQIRTEQTLAKHTELYERMCAMLAKSEGVELEKDDEEGSGS